MLWEPVSERLAKEAIVRAIKAKDDATKEAIGKRRAVYDGSLTSYLNEKIDILFSVPEERVELKKLASKSVNLLRYVVDELSTVYRYGVTREWVGGGGDVDEKATLSYKHILEQAEATETLERVNKLVTLTHDCILQYSYTKNGHTLFPLTRDRCDIIQDSEDPRRAVGIIWCRELVDTPIFNGNADKVTDKRWYYWDADKIVEYDKDGNRVRQYDEGGNYIGYERRNPYWKLNQASTDSRLKIFYPFIDYHDSVRDDTFWREYIDESLFEAAVELCLWLTYLNAQLKYQTLKQPWESSAATGGTGGNRQARTFMHVYRVPAGGDAGMFDYTVDLSQTLNCARDKVRLFCKTNGLPDDAFVLDTGNPASGVALKVKRLPLDEKRQSQIKHFIPREKALGECIKYASNPAGANFTGYPKEQVIPGSLKSSEMNIIFSDAPVPVDLQSDKDYWEWKIARGIATPADYIVAKNHNITKEEAEKIVLDNTNTNNEIESARKRASLDGELIKLKPSQQEEE